MTEPTAVELEVMRAVDRKVLRRVIGRTIKALRRPQLRDKREWLQGYLEQLRTYLARVNT